MSEPVTLRKTYEIAKQVRENNDYMLNIKDLDDKYELPLIGSAIKDDKLFEFIEAIKDEPVIYDMLIFHAADLWKSLDAFQRKLPKWILEAQKIKGSRLSDNHRVYMDLNIYSTDELAFIKKISEDDSLFHYLDALPKELDCPFDYQFVSQIFDNPFLYKYPEFLAVSSDVRENFDLLRKANKEWEDYKKKHSVKKHV